jgi:hypothetical protein
MATKPRTAARRPAQTDAPLATTGPADLAAALASLAQALATRHTVPPTEQGTTNVELAVMCQQLEHTAMALTHYFVHQARTQDGTTWDTIGKAFGVTRQTAHIRFGKGDAIDGRYADRRTTT